MFNNLKYSTLYSATLHNALAHGRLIDNVADTKVDVYLIVFRVKKDNNRLVYNHVYYPDIFTNSLLALWY